MLLKGYPNTFPYSLPPIVLSCSIGITEKMVCERASFQGSPYKKIIDQPGLPHIGSNSNQRT